ncbi:hypothetical protein ABIB82_007009 [Bradyrhizobium sp. i1.8.4]|uniref:hypothetical protein n=1 Tax=unclassified Bradyrhizobium TaxID=2631580 RepID=UPI003D2016F8
MTVTSITILSASAGMCCPSRFIHLCDGVLVLLEIAQPAHVVALAVNRSPDLLANLDDPLLALAPFPLRANAGHRKSLSYNEQITPDVQIHFDHATPKYA